MVAEGVKAVPAVALTAAAVESPQPDAAGPGTRAMVAEE